VRTHKTFSSLLLACCARRGQERGEERGAWSNWKQLVMGFDVVMDASFAGVCVQKADYELHHRVRHVHVIGADMQHHQLHHSKV
jgi:hypothetical protein